jgi:hypothetical protein
MRLCVDEIVLENHLVSTADGFVALGHFAIADVSILPRLGSSCYPVTHLSRLTNIQLLSPHEKDRGSAWSAARVKKAGCASYVTAQGQVIKRRKRNPNSVS